MIDPKEISELTQELLEQEVLKELNNIGLEFQVHDAMPISVYQAVLRARKAFTAYVDNARLLRTNQPKENTSI
jgi:hypothetical protein